MKEDEVRNIIEDWFSSQYSKIRVTKNDAQSIPDGTVTKVEYDDEDYDNLGEYDNSTNYRFTATKAGYYLIHASLLWNADSWTAGKHVILYVRKNGVNTISSLHEIKASGTFYLQNQVSTIAYLVAEDYIEVFVTHNQGAARNTHAAADYNHFSIHRLS